MSCGLSLSVRVSCTVSVSASTDAAVGGGGVVEMWWWNGAGKWACVPLAAAQAHNACRWRVCPHAMCACVCLCACVCVLAMFWRARYSQPAATAWVGFVVVICAVVPPAWTCALCHISMGVAPLLVDCSAQPILVMMVDSIALLWRSCACLSLLVPAVGLCARMCC